MRKRNQSREVHFKQRELQRLGSELSLFRLGEFKEQKNGQYKQSMPSKGRMQQKAGAESWSNLEARALSCSNYNRKSL